MKAGVMNTAGLHRFIRVEYPREGNPLWHGPGPQEEGEGEPDTNVSQQLKVRDEI